MKTNWKRIPSRSKRRIAEDKVYANLKRVFLRTHTYCSRCGEWLAPAERQIHHWAKRAGKLYLEDRLWLCLCSDCHIHYIHGDERRAQREGWLAPVAAQNDHAKALKAFERLEWNTYLVELDGVE